ncbi:MAG TPA: matrixin family metalloprotease, partial [Polyangium sp.]|nr:matrixin family metalloprotease [Polyangium sp.]
MTGLLQNPFNPCKKVFGFAQSSQQWVYVEAGAMGSNDTKFVLSHELGHRLGLNHPDDNLSAC